MIWQILGGLMIIAFVVGIVAATVRECGAKEAMVIWFGAIAMTAFVVLAVLLLMGVIP